MHQASALRGLAPTATPTLDGVKTPVFDSGPSHESEAVVFVHGNPGPMDDWALLAQEAKALGRVIAMDMPAFGHADRSSHFDYTVKGYARHLGQVLTWGGVERAHLVLHDFGGAWGLHWARANPKAVASLTLINTGVLRDYTWHRFARLWQTPLVGELFQLAANRTAIAAVMNHDNPTPFPAWFTDRVTRHADLSQKLAVLSLYRSARHAEAAFPDPHLDVPVCVIWGASDRYLHVSHAEAQRAWFRDIEVHLLDGLGHWPFIDGPDAVQACLLPFLQRQLHPVGG